MAFASLEPAMTAATEAHYTLPLAADPPSPSEGSRVHPMIYAGKWIAADLFSTLLFVALYAVTHSVFVATGLAIAAGVAQIAYLRLRGATIDAMQWVSLALVMVFGGASLLTHDPRFIMLKPTLIYAVIGMVMLRPGWIARYQPPIALRWSRDVVNVFGYVWAGLMFLTGALNLALVAHGDPKLWAWWIGVFPIASKLSLFAVQYLTTRAIVVARVRANAAAALAG
jgi:intracellular septation protein A